MSARHPATGILLFVLGLMLFACMDTTVKYLTARYPVPVVAGLRYLVHLSLMVVLMGPSQGRKLVQTTRTRLVLVRACCLAFITLTVSFALQRMPVAETTAIFYLSPLLVVLAAGRVLGEQVGAVDWLATLAGFAGILLIARPGSALDPVGVAFALAAVGVMVVYQLLSRVLASTETTQAMLFYTALCGSLAFGSLVPLLWQGPLPSLHHALLFLLIGAAGGGGHFLFTAAYRQMPASTLAPMMYLQLIWAGLLGWLVFDHVPDHLSLAGMAIVAGCGVLVGVRSQRAHRRPTPAEDAEA